MCFGKDISFSVLPRNTDITLSLPRSRALPARSCLPEPAVSAHIHQLCLTEQRLTVIMERFGHRDGTSCQAEAAQTCLQFSEFLSLLRSHAILSHIEVSHCTGSCVCRQCKGFIMYILAVFYLASQLSLKPFLCIYVIH